MKLTNNTHWNTADLRRIATRVCREEFPRDRFPNFKVPFGAKDMRVVVGYNRGSTRTRMSSGHAQYGSRWAYVNVPSGGVDAVDFAHVLAHELGHCKGLRHGAMPPHMESTTVVRRSDYIRQHFAWAAALPIRKQAPKRKPRATADDKLAHASRMLKRAETRLKLAKTIAQRWHRKVAYYTKQTTLAAAARRPEGTDGTS